MEYTFRIIIEPDEGNTYHGFAPALPGCHTWGQTIEQTRANLRDAMQAYLASLADDGEPIPLERGFESFETVTGFQRPAAAAAPVPAHA